MRDETLSRALIAFVGQSGRLDDRSPEDRVVAQVGGAAALDALPRLEALLDALYSADLQVNAATEAELGERAGNWLRQHWQELSPEAIRAAANRFAYDWR